MKGFYIKYIAGGLLTVFLLQACTHKIQPVIPERERVQITQQPVAQLTGDSQRGQQLFNAKCDRCHGLPEPGLYTVPRWETIMSSMARKARLDEQETADVKLWLFKQAKQN